MRRILCPALATVVVALAATACGGSSGPSKAARSAFVEARAQALCTVKDHAYSTERQLESTYLAAQRADISAGDEKKLKAMLDKDAKLNGDISVRVATLCG